MPEMSIQQKLGAIQTTLKAKKNIYNKFGKFYYRNLEGIYESVKPLLAKYGCFLVIDNEIVEIGSHIFRKSIATLGCAENESEIKVTTYTQEAFSKSGMSPEQCSGSAASYGDKYVLNKLFCLDDSDSDNGTLDPDSDKESPTTGANPDNPANFKITFGKFNGKTIGQVDKTELKNFCQWLSQQEGKGDMQNRLLSNAKRHLLNG